MGVVGGVEMTVPVANIKKAMLHFLATGLAIIQYYVSVIPKGRMESMTLDHDPARRDGGFYDFEPLWPEEHAIKDKFYHGGN